jgi:hypothetical protein
VYYCARHIQRGEYYDVATDFGPLRQIVEVWHARLAGRPFFEVRRVHEREPETVAAFADLFPRPERASLRRALLKLIDLHERQRSNVDAEWRTSDEARTRIRAMVEAL